MQIQIQTKFNIFGWRRARRGRRPVRGLESARVQRDRGEGRLGSMAWQGALRHENASS